MLIFKDLLTPFAAISGRRIVLLSVMTVPLGIAMGLVEIWFGLSLQRFLVAFNLIPEATGDGSAVPVFAGVVVQVVVLAAAIAAFATRILNATEKFIEIIIWER